MRIGIPTEIKNNEYRVAATPAGVDHDTGAEKVSVNTAAAPTITQ